MTHVISLALALLLLWLGLSGHFEPLLLLIGLASTVLAVFLAKRMEVLDHESHPIHLTGRLFRFWGYLSREVVLANIDVIKRILTPGKSISPQLVKLPLPQQTDLGKVIYANAITLTPGTVSVQLDRSEITVHALAKESAEELGDGEMARRVPDDKEPRA